MASNTFDNNIRFKAIDKISRTLNKITNKFPKMTRMVKRTNTAFGALQKRTEKLRKKLSAVGGSMLSVGKNMTASLTLPIAAFGAFSLKTAGDFQSAMKNVQGKTGIAGTSEAFKNLNKLAKQMGRDTQFSAKESADAMGFLAQAGLDAKQIMGALPGTLNLAAAAGIELAEAADISTNVLAGYGLQVKDNIQLQKNLNRLNDVMVAATNKSNINIQELSETMKVAGPIFASQNQNLERTVSIVGQLGNAGIKGSESGVALRKSMSSLLKPTATAIKTFKKLGIKKSDIQDSAGNVKDFGGIIDLLAKRGAKAADLIGIFGERAGPKLIPLIAGGGKAIDELAEKLVKADGVNEASRVAKLRMEGFNGAIKKLKSAFEAFSIAIAQSGILDFFTGLINFGAKVFSKLSALPKPILLLGAGFATLIAAAGPILIAFGGFIAILPALITGWGVFTGVMAGFSVATLPISGTVLAVVAAIAALVGITVLIIKKWDAIKKKAKEVAAVIKSSILSAITSLIKKMKGIPGFGLLSRFVGGGEGSSEPTGVPTGAPTGGADISQRAATTQTNNAQVGVRFENPPPGTKISTEGGAGFLDISSGAAGI